MDISKLGASQSSSLARSAQHASQAASLANADLASNARPAALPAEKLGNVLRPRLQRFQDRIDKRLDEIRKDNTSTPEQEAAFVQVQKKFHAMMSRFDRIVKDGSAEGVLDHVLGHLSDAIHAAIHVDKTSANNVATSSTGTQAKDVAPNALGQIDTLA